MTEHLKASRLDFLINCGQSSTSNTDVLQQWFCKLQFTVWQLSDSTGVLPRISSQQSAYKPYQEVFSKWVLFHWPLVLFVFSVPAWIQDMSSIQEATFSMHVVSKSPCTVPYYNVLLNILFHVTLPLVEIAFIFWYDYHNIETFPL